MSEGKGRVSQIAVGRAKPTSAGGGTNGSTIRLLKLYEVAVDPASIAANTGAETDVTVTGVTTDDMVVACEAQAALNNGITFNARVKAANTVAIMFSNSTIGAIDIASTNFKILCARIADADV